VKRGSGVVVERYGGGFLLGRMVLVCCLLVGAGRAQEMNSLDDFQLNPFSDPPRAQFWFRHPPVFEQSETGETERVLTLVCPRTANRATPAKYLRHFPEKYPLKSLEVSEREEKGGTSLVVRFALRKGYTARPSTSGQTVTVTFVETPPVVVAPPTANPEPPEPQESAPTPSEKPAPVVAPSPTKRSVAPTPSHEVEKTPSPSGASAQPATTEAASPPLRESLGRFFEPILMVAGGILILVAALVGGGFVLVWSWASLRGVAERRRELTSRKVFATAREMNRVLEQFRVASEETLEDAMERHRTTLEALRRDVNGVRQSVAELVEEFERATRSVALMEPEAPSVRVEGGSAVERLPEEAPPKGTPPGRTEERRQSVREWIARVSARVAEEGVGGTQAETLARRIEGARVDPSELLAPLEPDFSEPPSEEETEPTPAEETNRYDKARDALASGATPFEVAQRTGLSLGEVELIAQLERVRREPKK